MGSFGRCSLPVYGCLYIHAHRTCIGMFPRCRRHTLRGCDRSDCAYTCSTEASVSLCISARSGRRRMVHGCRPRKAHACPCSGRSDDDCRRFGEASPHPDIPAHSICSTRSCHLPFAKVFVLYHIYRITRCPLASVWVPITPRASRRSIVLMASLYPIPSCRWR